MDHRGRSRTRSFRQSFLISYAVRIGERLKAVTESTVAESAASGQLVPLVRRQAERVDKAVTELFPQLVTRGASISNQLGWVAGRAAADMAVLDTRGELSEEAG